MFELLDITKLIVASILPIILSIAFYFLDRETKFKNIDPLKKQVIFGFSFGILSIIGSEFGYAYLGAQINCRDAAPLCAGLFFGPLAGIIAGLCGGIERWFAVYWGAGTFTRVACSIATILAGMYAAFLRGVLFEDRRPFWMLSFTTAVICEAFHLLLVIITNMDDVSTAYLIISNISIQLILLNSVSVGLTALILSAISKNGVVVKNKKVRISQVFQKWLFRSFAIAFVVSTWFLFSYQTSLSKQQAKNIINLSIRDVKDSIEDICDTELLAIAHQVANRLDNGESFDVLLKEYNIADISIINSEGIITETSDERFINFDMSSGEQSMEFLVLLGDTTELAQKYQPMTYNSGETVEYHKYAGVKYKDGFIQVGYNADQFQDIIDERIFEFASNRHIGENGFILLVDNNKKIVYIPPQINIDGKENVDILQYEPGSLQEAEIDKENYFFSYDTTEGYIIVGAYPYSEALRTRNIAILINNFVELIVFAGLYIMIFILINKVVVGRIKKFNYGLNEISNGNLDITLDIRSNREYSDLSDDINKTVGTLKKYINEAEERMKTELELANNIQKSSLPIVTPIISKRNDFDISPFMATAKEVGGDFYDFYFTNGHTLNFVVADVSGKGIPAALFMMRAKTELRNLSENGYSVNEVLEKGNEELCGGNDAGMFVTCWQGRINLDTGIVEYANGGHNPPIIKKKNGDTFFLKEKANFILGGLPTSKYDCKKLTLEKGDILFLYTDGVTEATNSSKELYGEDRLQKYIASHDFDTMDELCKGVKDDIDSFVLDAPQFDDITMLAFKYCGGREITTNNNLLKVTNVQLDVECNDWKDAIRSVSNLLVRAGSAHESYAEDLIQTVEELGPYIVLLPGFALAHTEPGKKSVYKDDVSLITLKKGINFNSPNDPVRVMIAISSLNTDSHVNMLQTIATKMMDDDVVDKILECKNEDEIVNLFKN